MELPELLLIDKPVGITSFDVIRILRKKTGVKKFGHAGTLDPRASGLMLLGVGSGTKRLADLVKLDKSYVATIRIGEQRTTGDLEGEVLRVQAVTEDIDVAVLTSAIESMVGTLTLPVSAYSAIKKDGVPMYKRARKAAEQGAVVTDVPVRQMVVYSAELKGSAYVMVDGVRVLELEVYFAVASGVYIRSLAEELGNRLGYPATLAALRRTVVGPYRVEDAQQLDDF